MVRIGKKFLHPHFCPRCGKLVVLARHPLSVHCPNCQRYKQRKRAGAKEQQKKYCTGTYRRLKKNALAEHPYCALCGSEHDLTCHHTVSIKSGEWRGRHLTVLCQRCHRIWETKVNKLRNLEKQNV